MALQYQVALPLAVSLVLYVVIGFVRPEDTPERDALIELINTDGDGPGVPAQAGPGEDAIATEGTKGDGQRG